MKYIKYLCIAVLALSLHSCGTTTSNRSFSPDLTQLHILMDDLVFIGETEVEMSYSTYLYGLFYNIHTVNGQDYDATQKKITKLESRFFGGLGKLDKATYKVLDQYPEARYFQVVRRTKVKDKLFLGNSVKETAIIRAYKFKDGCCHKSN